jgi:NAD(P)H-flavin reductase/ferredoxin
MTYHVHIGHTDILFPAEAGETILDAAERAGYALPYSCRKGVCSTCEAALRAGTIQIGSQSVEGPKSAVLLCRAKPTSDVVVNPRRIEQRDLAGTKTIDAWVFRISWPSSEVAVLLLRFPVSIRAKFKAGQYLRVLSSDGTARNFSLANAPQESDGAHLHIRRIEGGRFSDGVLAHLKAGDHVRIEIPFGDFYLREESDRPILFLATGAAFAPVKSMMEYLIRRQSRRAVRFYWSGRHMSDLYLRQLPEKWARRYPWFDFAPVLTASEASWRGRKGLVHRAVIDDIPDLSEYQAYACGNPLMIRKARADFVTKANLPEHQFFAEPFIVTGN